jgi:hypothetical protein
MADDAFCRNLRPPDLPADGRQPGNKDCFLPATPWESMKHRNERASPMSLRPYRQRAVNPATIRAAITAAIKDAGHLHIPEGRRDHTTPPEPSVPTASIRTAPTFTPKSCCGSVLVAS